MSRDHPLAQRDEVSIEDVADYKVGWFDTLPAGARGGDPALPTPRSGRPIERLRRPIRSLSELAMLVERGDIVHLTVPSMADYWGPGIVYVPVIDLPESTRGARVAPRQRRTEASESSPVSQPRSSADEPQSACLCGHSVASNSSHVGSGPLGATGVSVMRSYCTPAGSESAPATAPATCSVVR